MAALLVIPFVLWQSVTGTVYLWSESWVDHRHPDLRFVAPGDAQVPLDHRVDAARLAVDAAVASVIVPGDPTRSTQVMFNDPSGLPRAVFVDPYDGRVLGGLAGRAWPVGWSRSLHGGWPLGDAGSWLLEIGAGWTIVMVLTGLYLWWPRDGRGARALLPRLHAGPRIFWRDLHACVAVWFALLIVAFLLTALPWTSFWGGRVLAPVQQALGQQAPPAAGFAPVFAPPPDTQGDASAAAEDPANRGRLQAMLARARAHGLRGDLVFLMVDGPPGAGVFVRSATHAQPEHAQYLLLDRSDARVLDTADWSDFPPVARAVATGVQIHEARYFGRFGPWVNTTFALALTWLCVTGAMAWWRRRPARGLGVPPRPTGRWPGWLRLAAAGLFIVLPLLALSSLLLWLLDGAWQRLTARPPTDPGMA